VEKYSVKFGDFTVTRIFKTSVGELYSMFADKEAKDYGLRVQPIVEVLSILWTSG
jgi:hypothetical protein